MLTYYLTSLGIVPYFSLRAFAPLFTTAMLARFGTSMPWLADVPGIQLLSVLPPWATSPASLILLGLLAILELVAAKIPELREVMSLSDAQIKSIAAFLLCFSIVKGNPMELVQHIGNVGLSTDFSWGQSFAYGWSFAIGTVVWFTAVMRNAVFGFLIEIDEDDSLGIQALLSWLEDSMGFLGVLFAVIFPTLALIAVGLTLLSLWLLRRYLEHREEKAKTPCTQCGAPNPPCGLYCASCNTARRRVQNVGLVGTIKETLASDLTAHRLQLLARKRCGYCGERLAEKRLSQHCGSCGTAPFENSAAVEIYLTSLRATLPRTLAILLLASAIPVLGLIPGVIYYRVSLISSLRCYIPRSVGFMARWMIRFINMFLLCIQPIPLLGMLTLPLLCLVNFSVYQALIRRQSSVAFASQLEPISASV